MKLISHKFDPKLASEIVILEDDHGRQHHVHIQILRNRCPSCHIPLPGGVVDPDQFLQQTISRLEEDEAKIHQHMAERFDPITLKKK